MSGNDDNRKFYNNVPLDIFQSMAKQGGFADYKDLKLISNDIPSTARILELGAGYGRCIDFLIKEKHKGEIIALEQSDVLHKVLLEKYSGDTLVKVMHKDIKSLEDELFKVDVILWLFSGLIDFAKEEQVPVLKKLRTLLHTGGKLFVDIPQLKNLTVAKYISEQDIVMDTPYGSIKTYLPSFEEMEHYGVLSGFSSVVKTDYDTDTGKHRSMYLFVA